MKTLETLDVSYNNISDKVMGLITTALGNNNTLKKLSIGGETTTDEGALSLAAALTANSSMKDLELYWSSTHPHNTLWNIGECVSKSTLRRLRLEMSMPVSAEAPVTEERATDWLQHVELGGKELILSLENSRLEELQLMLYYETHAYFKDKKHHSHQLDRSRQGLMKTVPIVNTTRKEKRLPELDTIILDSNYY